MIGQGMNSKGLHHKEDHSLTGIKIYFMVIVLLVITFDIMLDIVELMEEMVKWEMCMWLHTILSVTNEKIMDT